jgi:probable rRNA maturation factor
MPDDLPRLLVSDRQDLPVELVPLLQAARRVLIAEDAKAAELSISFVSREEMEALHTRWMGEPGPTDVLAFEIGETDDEGVRILGDVVICPDVAKEGANAFDDELRLLLVHGILHLLGHDHEELADRRAMWEKQEAHTGIRVQL